jgi:topoisomerase-4 subunit B
MSRVMKNTTHDWASTVDVDHLEQVRRAPGVFAPGGLTHLVLEVLAYAADEAESTGATGHCVVRLHVDGSVSVADNGRGTDTRMDELGRPIKKPVIATRDLRFFDSPDAPHLPDGCPRRGMSTVAALSTWLVHTNRRHHGAWTQRYEHGIPVTGLLAIPDQHTTGTTVHFMPTNTVNAAPGVSRAVLRLAAGVWPHLSLEVIDEGSP